MFGWLLWSSSISSPWSNHRQRISSNGATTLIITALNITTFSIQTLNMAMKKCSTQYNNLLRIVMLSILSITTPSITIKNATSNIATPNRTIHIMLSVIYARCCGFILLCWIPVCWVSQRQHMYAECLGTYIGMLSVAIKPNKLNVVWPGWALQLSPTCRYIKCQYAECHGTYICMLSLSAPT